VLDLYTSNDVNMLVQAKLRCLNDLMTQKWVAVVFLFVLMQMLTSFENYCLSSAE